MTDLAPYTAIADAIVQLFGPEVEVVIHDLYRDSIFYIANNRSGRKVGENSFLQINPETETFPSDVIGPYEKPGEQGQPVRSITAVLRNAAQTPIGMLCINVDHERHLKALDTLRELIAPASIAKRPEVLFRNEWQQQVKDEIAHFTEQRDIGRQMSASQRRELIASLDAKGIFYAKRSIEQLSSLLDVSRATLYKDLAAARKNDPLKVIS